jgi:parallel beta-helix repeat protein
MPACGWEIDQCGCGSCWDKHTPATREKAAALAIHVMWAATGRRYGECELTVMPCNPQQPDALYQTYPVANSGGYDPFGGGSTMQPVLEAGQWRNRCGGGCSCSAVCEVNLDGPISDVVEVTVDGDVVDPAAYEVHDGHLLVRKDGDCWPTCQTYGVEVPGFTVTYLRGDPIPPAVQAAAEILACEYAKACTGGDCALPNRLASLSRQGVEVTVADVPTVGGQVRTGIKMVDDIIAADNPYGRAERPQVVSPDLPPLRVVTWTASSGPGPTPPGLTDSVTSDMIVDGTIVNADINSAAAIALSKLAIDPLARANHTGTQLAATVSDFDTRVRTSRLDQMAAPAADVSLNGHKLVGVADGTAVTDAATVRQLRAAAFNVRDYGAAGDGTSDDTAAVQAAVVAAAAAGGGTVLFPWGVYATSGLVLQGLSNVTLRGDRGAVLTLLPNTTGAPNRASANVLTMVSCTDFAVESLTVDGRRDTLLPMAVLTQAASAGQPSVRIAHGASASYRVGQRLNLNGGLTAAGGADKDKQDQQLAILSLTVGAGSDDDTITFTTNLANAYTAAAGTVSDGYGPIAGLGAYVTPWQTGDTTIAGRHLTEEDQQQGIHLIDCARFVVRGCAVQGMWESGIRMGTHLLDGTAQNDGCSDAVIAGNVIHHCYDQGIGVWVSRDITVSGNVCDATGWAAISLTLSDDCTVSDNVCLNSVQRIPNDTNAGYGIAIEGGIRNVAAGNKVRGSYASGVYLTAGGTFPFAGPAQLATTVAAGSNGVALPTGTVNVASTAGFATAGQVTVLSSAGAQQITYTGKTGTSFTGCTGGVGTLFTAQKAAQYPVFLNNGAALQIGSTSTVVSDGTKFQLGGRYSIVDGPRTERILVTAIVGNTLTLAQPTTFRHPDKCQISQAVAEANSITGNAIADSGDAGIRLSSAIRTTIQGNIIDRSGLRGVDGVIWSSGGLQPPYGTVVQGNTITAPDTTADGAAYQGIGFQQTSDVAIVGNRVGGALSTSGSVNALMVQGCTDVLIAGNALSDIYNVGIRVDAMNDWQCRRVTVSGNIVSRCLGEGILAFGGIGLAIVGNTLTGCAANNGPHGFGGALNLRGVSRSLVCDNIVYNNGHGAISLDTAVINAVNVFTHDNVFARNVCYDDGGNYDPFNGALTQQAHGIKEVAAGQGPNTYDTNVTVGNGTNVDLASAGNANILSSLNNLSDVASAAAARTNLGALASTNPTALGDLEVDKADLSKGYRFRTSGGALDVDAAAADVFLSVFSGAGYTGTQRTYLRLESGASIAHAVERWQFGSSPFGGTVLDVDPAGAALGFFGTGAATKPTVVGSRGGNAALASLLTGLAGLGLITDSSSA